MSNCVERLFAVDHPTAEGHFPGHPIIPGAVLLEEVLHAVGADGEGLFTSCEIRSAKFLRPVRPGDRVVIRWTTLGSGETKFECLSQERPVLTGTIRLYGTQR